MRQNLDIFRRTTNNELIKLINGSSFMVPFQPLYSKTAGYHQLHIPNHIDPPLFVTKTVIWAFRLSGIYSRISGITPEKSDLTLIYARPGVGALDAAGFSSGSDPADDFASRWPGLMAHLNSERIRIR